MKQIIKWTAEGAVKCVFAQSILQRAGIRQLPEICWYLDKGTVGGRETRWHRG